MNIQFIELPFAVIGVVAVAVVLIMVDDWRNMQKDPSCDNCYRNGWGIMMKSECRCDRR